MRPKQLVIGVLAKAEDKLKWYRSEQPELVSLKQAGSLNAAARARRHPDGAACLV